MPEYFRSLIVIMLLSVAFFALAKQPASLIIGRTHFTTRRNLWLELTLAAFLAPNFWVFAFIVAALLIYTNRREDNPPALYFFILFALPVAAIQIPGLGLINYFFDLSYARILELFILLPAFFILLRKQSTLSFGRTGPDKILAAYFLLVIILNFRDTTFTDTLRQLFYLFIDVFLPYFVISRSLTNLQAFKDALLSMLLPIMIVALIAVFEAYKHWILYAPLLDELGVQGMTDYLGRAGMLRVVATAGQPIALGYLMAVGIGIYLFFQKSFQQKSIRRLGMALLVAGLVVPLSRGPWIGAALLIIVFIATGRNSVKGLLSFAVAGILSFALIAMLPGGEKLINLLPFIGKEEGTITYRADLLTSSIPVVERNLWLGKINYREEPELQHLLAGDRVKIIDIVNSYLEVVLAQGIIGLWLFVSFFVAVISGVYRAMRSLPDRESEEYLLGRVLLATILAILIIIYTVSSITIIPIVYWSFAGLGVAYAQMVREGKAGRFLRLASISASIPPSSTAA